MGQPRWKLSQKDRVDLSQSTLLLLILMIDADSDPDFDYAVVALLHELCAPGLPVVPSSRHSACFARFSSPECWRFFRFRKNDLPRLGAALRIPNILRANNCVYSGEEALLLLLRRLAYPNRLVDLVQLFGLYEGELSALFNAVLNHVFQLFHHLVTDLTPWIPHVPHFAQAISAKTGISALMIWCFVDGTLRPVARPTTGQRSQYSGHKRRHGLKFESVSLPNGLHARMFGPVDGRRHDIAMARQSGLYQALRSIHNFHYPISGENFACYGDAAYSAMLSPWICTGFRGAVLTQQQLDFNSRMSSARVSAEWAFGDIIRTFAFLDFKANLKILLQPVGMYYFVGTLLTNCRSCLYGNETSEFFSCPTPTLEDYLAGHP